MVVVLLLAYSRQIFLLYPQMCSRSTGSVGCTAGVRLAGGGRVGVQVDRALAGEAGVGGGETERLQAHRLHLQRNVSPTPLSPSALVFCIGT